MVLFMCWPLHQDKIIDHVTTNMLTQEIGQQGGGSIGKTRKINKSWITHTLFSIPKFINIYRTNATVTELEVWICVSLFNLHTKVRRYTVKTRQYLSSWWPYLKKMDSISNLPLSFTWKLYTISEPLVHLQGKLYWWGTHRKRTKNIMYQSKFVNSCTNFFPLVFLV